MCHVTCDMWNGTHDTWHVTCDTWHMTPTQPPPHTHTHPTPNLGGCEEDLSKKTAPDGTDRQTDILTDRRTWWLYDWIGLGVDSVKIHYIILQCTCQSGSNDYPCLWYLLAWYLLPVFTHSCSALLLLQYLILSLTFPCSPFFLSDISPKSLKNLKSRIIALVLFLTLSPLARVTMVKSWQ